MALSTLWTEFSGENPLLEAFFDREGGIKVFLPFFEVADDGGNLDFVLRILGGANCFDWVMLVLGGWPAERLEEVDCIFLSCSVTSCPRGEGSTFGMSSF
mmetsp:Transcript_42141/g.64630  ORF Transcript_42141/g.64630 Transcript_42141/m.64630 type:complete len:100 (+) Transcript_42141:1293-1592(+)